MLRTIRHTDSGQPDVWVDLVSPTTLEIEKVQREFDIKVPDLTALKEIETTSRLRADGEKLYMSAPVIAASEPDEWQIAPIGFILLPTTLITVRYTELAVFDAVASEFEKAAESPPGLAFASLREEMVDRAADHLERAAEIVNVVSQRILRMA